MALKPITLWYAYRWSDSEWNNQAWGNQLGYIALHGAVQQVAAEMGLYESDGALYVYRHTGDELDDKLKISRLQLPQLLFSTPAQPGGDGLKVNEAVFLAKLVGNQITKENIKIMLTAVRRLERKEEGDGKIHFYDPSLHLLSGIGVRNISGAPGEGGYFLGLNPLRHSLTINRQGQKLQEIVQAIKKVAPWALLALGAYAASRNQ